MWYYVYITFLLFFSLLFARVNSAYHPNLLMRKYVVVRSKKIQKLFISRSNPLEMKGDNRKQYRNKLTVLGLVFYVLWLCLAVFSIGFLAWGPRTPIDSFEFGDGFFVSTQNQAVIFMMLLVFLGFEMSSYFLNIMKSPSINQNKVIKLLWIVEFVFMFFISIAAAVEAIKMFF